MPRGEFAQLHRMSVTCRREVSQDPAQRLYPESVTMPADTVPQGQAARLETAAALFTASPAGNLGRRGSLPATDIRACRSVRSKAKRIRPASIDGQPRFVTVGANAVVQTPALLSRRQESLPSASRNPDMPKRLDAVGRPRRADGRHGFSRGKSSARLVAPIRKLPLVQRCNAIGQQGYASPFPAQPHGCARKGMGCIKDRLPLLAITGQDMQALGAWKPA